MTPERKGEVVWFSVPEAARVLGVTRQAVYAAINAGYLKATKATYGKQIRVEDLLGYGIRVGKEPQVLLDRVKQETEASLDDLLRWVLAGLGLFLLITLLSGKK